MTFPRLALLALAATIGATAVVSAKVPIRFPYTVIDPCVTHQCHTISLNKMIYQPTTVQPDAVQYRLVSAKSAVFTIRVGPNRVQTITLTSVHGQMQTSIVTRAVNR